MRGTTFDKEGKKSGFKHVVFEVPIRNLWHKRVNCSPNQFSSTYTHKTRPHFPISFIIKCGHITEL